MVRRSAEDRNNFEGVERMTRIVQAFHILDEQNRPIAVFYPKDGIKPFPMKITPPQPFERVREPTAPMILDNRVHADMVRKIYRDVQGY